MSRYIKLAKSLMSHFPDRFRGLQIQDLVNELESMKARGTNVESIDPLILKDSMFRSVSGSDVPPNNYDAIDAAIYGEGYNPTSEGDIPSGSYDAIYGGGYDQSLGEDIPYGVYDPIDAAIYGGGYNPRVENERINYGGREKRPEQRKLKPSSSSSSQEYYVVPDDPFAVIEEIGGDGSGVPIQKQLELIYDQGVDPTELEGFMGGLKRGYLHGQRKPHEYRNEEGEREIQIAWSKPFYKQIESAQVAGLNDWGKLGYRLGRIGADITGNATRHNIWNIHPAEIATREAFRHIYNTPSGLKDINKPLAVGLGVGGAFLGAEALGVMSGNYNPLNIEEGMRPAGYQALTPDEDDPTKSNAPALDILQRHVLGRRGKILDWEQFRLERPDVPYEKYRKYRDWQSGKDQDPVGATTFGVAKVNLDGLSGPEASLVGYTMTPLGLGAALGTVHGMRLLNEHLAKQAIKATKQAI